MSVALELLQMQLAQKRHDEISHRDILSLRVQERITHMTLHFAKYCGLLADARTLPDLEKMKATIVDAFIILLASANCLNKRVTDLMPLPSEMNASSLANTAALLARDSGWTVPIAYDRAVIEMVKITGRMAKACESMDHLEAFDYRGVLESELGKMARTLLVFSFFLSLDLRDRVRLRWSRIEEKDIFSASGEGNRPPTDGAPQTDSSKRLLETPSER